MSKLPLAPKILRELYEAGALYRNSIDAIFADIADEHEIEEALRGLSEAGLVKCYSWWDEWSLEECEEWYPRDSPLFWFLNETAGEFTQKQMAEALKVSLPNVSRRLKLLRRLGLVKAVRTENIKPTGGRRTLYKRIG